MTERQSSALSESQIRALDQRGPTALREAGCTCEFGCRSCGMSEYQMGNCPSFNPCPTGRALGNECPVHGNG